MVTIRNCQFKQRRVYIILMISFQLSDKNYLDKNITCIGGVSLAIKP